LSSELAGILRRIKPEKRIVALKPRDASSLAFLGQSSRLPSKLLYDTTVYIDILQGTFPRDGEIALRTADAWHSTVTAAELCAPIGSLNPAHPGTGEVVRQLTAAIERRPVHRTIAPDREIWLEAGILTGVLARIQQYSVSDRHRVLNDALLFSTARKHGLTVLTRNVRDFDLLQQLEASCSVLLYTRS
jgi:predicted nucleic acid-binding protein